MACVELPCQQALHQISNSSKSFPSSHAHDTSRGCFAGGPLLPAPFTFRPTTATFSLSFLNLPCSKTLDANPYTGTPHRRNTCALCLAVTDAAKFHFAVRPSLCCRPASFASCSTTGKPSVYEFDSDSGSDSDRAPEQADLQELAEEMLSSEDKALPVPSEEISWLLMEGQDVPMMVSNLPVTERYAPRRLLEFVSKKLDSQMFSLAQLKSTLMFWQKKKKLQQEAHTFATSAFEGKKGVSQLYQWTATELTLQHNQLSRIARDVFYLILACSLLGFVRVLEALVVTFSSSPPRFIKLLDAMNSLDFFTVAFLAYSLRKPIIGILRVDPTNLDEVSQLKGKIWDEMHKFYERQWKVVATLGVGRLLALVAQTLPSTNAMTKNVKMGWDMLLALPIF